MGSPEQRRRGRLVTAPHGIASFPPSVDTTRYRMRGRLDCLRGSGDRDEQRDRDHREPPSSVRVAAWQRRLALSWRATTEETGGIRTLDHERSNRLCAPEPPRTMDAGVTRAPPDGTPRKEG